MTFSELKEFVLSELTKIERGCIDSFTKENMGLGETFEGSMMPQCSKCPHPARDHEWRIQRFRGRRDDATCQKLLNKIGLEGNTFVTDDWEGYHRLIPDDQLFTGKDLTVPIEQDNSNIRHFLARFRRRNESRLQARSKWSICR
jgi:hypothetical protein